MAVAHFLTAKKNKDDEYYTLYEDVEKDLRHYVSFFSGKTVYCPCDDYRTSAFVRYFKRNFHILHLKALLASNYNTGSGAYKYKYDGTFEIVYPTPTGDFNSQEIEPMLTHCDIIVTNPPFSKLVEFFNRIMSYQKDILVMAPLTSVGYRNIFPYIKNDSLRADIKGQRYFDTPSGNGKCFGNIVYLTTLKPERHTLELKETYSPEKYPKYDNYDAINVDRCKDIPIDYDGVMGVPITFLGHYNPEQFEIVGLAQGSEEVAGEFYNGIVDGIDYDGGRARPYVNNKPIYSRILIRRRNSTLS